MNTSDTKHRAIQAACVAFSARGFTGTSLDELAQSLGVTKQTILYHFSSKNGLLEAVIEHSAKELLDVFAQASTESDPGWDRVEKIVRATFSLAVKKPELLALLREVTRLGGGWSDQLTVFFRPLIEDAVSSLQESMSSGTFRAADPQLVLVSAYSTVTGSVDTEVLRAVGLELDLRVAARLRKTLLLFLRSALLAEE